MKALMGIGYGNVTGSTMMKSVPVPEPGRGEVLVKVNAVSINPIDYKIVKGMLKRIKKLPIPYNLGFDLAGVVEKTGPDCVRFKKGDEVFGRVADRLHDAFAEYALAEEKDLAHKPAQITFSEAAAVPLVGLTTIQALEELGGLKKGDKIFIHAGSGGIGTFAIQFAKLKGADVTTTTSTENVELVKSLGADRVIDYKHEDYRISADKYDLVYDTLGGDYTKDSLNLLKNGGRMVSIAGPIDAPTLAKFGLKGLTKWIALAPRRKLNHKLRIKHLTYNYLYMHPEGNTLEKIGALMAKGSLKAVIDRTWNFPEISNAIAYVEKGHARGKVIARMS